MVDRVDNDQRGEIAETAFHALCLAARATPNRPDRDRFGWDRHVTLHIVDPNRGSFEQRETERRLKVQVKACTPGDSSVAITLSNAERMVKEQGPWFVFIGRFPVDATEVSESFLVHVDKDFITRVLKRLRELADEPTAKLHEREVSVPFNERHRVRSGAELRACWDEALLVTEAAYGAEKQRHRETVGLAKHVGSFSINAPSDSAAFKRLVAWKLGLAPLKVESFEIGTVRFGIPDTPTVHRDVTFDPLESPNTGPSSIEFFNAANDLRVCFETTTHTTRGLPGLPLEHHAVRLRGALFSVLIHDLQRQPCALTMRFEKPDLDDPIDIADAHQIGVLVTLLHRARARRQQILCQIKIEDFESEAVLGRVQRVEDPGVVQFGLTAAAAAQLFSSVGMQLRGATTTVRGLFKDYAGLNLAAAARVTNSTIDQIGITVGRNRPREDASLAFAPTFALETNRGVLMGLVVIVGTVKHARSQTRIEMKNPKPLRNRVHLVGQSRRAQIEGEVDAEVRALCSEYEAVVG